MMDWQPIESPVELPDGNTPLPPSNTTYHVLNFGTGYGTSERRMTMLCGVVRRIDGWEAEGEHKWFGLGEHWWHKHINCPACLQALHWQRLPEPPK